MRCLGLALLFASSVAASRARALPITLCGDVDFGADHAAARERIGASSGSASAPLALMSAPLAAAPLAVALDVNAKPKPLASAPLEVSFRRWDEGALSAPHASLALADPGR